MMSYWQPGQRAGQPHPRARRLRRGGCPAHLAQIERVNPALNAVRVYLAAEQALAAARAADVALVRAGRRCTESRSRSRTGSMSPAYLHRRRPAAPPADAGRGCFGGGLAAPGRRDRPRQDQRAGREPGPRPHQQPLQPGLLAHRQQQRRGRHHRGRRIAAGPRLRPRAAASASRPTPAGSPAWPTAGRVPLTGHFPFISAINDPRTVIGPLARHVEDLALALPIISGSTGAMPARCRCRWATGAPSRSAACASPSTPTTSSPRPAPRPPPPAAGQPPRWPGWARASSRRCRRASRRPTPSPATTGSAPSRKAPPSGGPTASSASAASRSSATCSGIAFARR